MLRRGLVLRFFNLGLSVQPLLRKQRATATYAKIGLDS